jgi:hypothetical protein
MVSVSFSINQIELAANLLYFAYTPSLVLSDLQMAPTYGTILGGTVVRITSPAIVKADDVYCKFGTLIVLSDLCENGLIICTSPPHIAEDVSVTFTLNGQNYGESLLFFLYHEHPVITYIEPIRGDLTTSTPVRIIGRNLKYGSDLLQCKFGDVIVPAQHYSDTSLSCVAPPLENIYERQRVSVALIPFSPMVQIIRAETSPLIGSRILMSVKAEKAIPQVTNLRIKVADVNERQLFRLGVNYNPVARALIRVKDSGRRQEVHLLQTTVKPVLERQAIIIRAPYNVIQSEHAEIQQVDLHNFTSSSIVTLELGTGVISFYYNSSSEFIENLMSNAFAEGYGVNVRITYNDARERRTYLFTFSKIFGDVDEMIGHVNAGEIDIRTVNQGGFCAIQNITLSGVSLNISSGYFRLGMDGEFTSNLYVDVSIEEMKRQLESLKTVGKVSVAKTFTNSSAYPVWTVTFLQRFGIVPLLDVSNFLIDGNVIVEDVRIGTTRVIEGEFALSLYGMKTEFFTTNASAIVVERALNALNIVNVDVTRYEFLNNGVMYLVEFKQPISNIETIKIDSSLMSATALNAEVVTQIDGSSISGTLLFYRAHMNEMMEEVRVESTPISYNSTSEEVKAALIQADNSLIDVVVTRTKGVVDGTFNWQITYPYELGNVVPMGINFAGLRGVDARCTMSTVLEGRMPSIQEISTIASTTLSGHFILTLEGHHSEPIPHNCSQSEMKRILESMPSVGEVDVSRKSTGYVDFNTWGGIVSSENIHLNYIHDVFEHELETYRWTITFISRSDYIPSFTACCSELGSEEYANVTLFSLYSRDSDVVIKRIHEGETQRIAGNASLVHVNTFYFDSKLNKIVSSARNSELNQDRRAYRQQGYFDLAATADEVKDALNFLGYGTSDTVVERSEIDENGHYSYLVTFNNNNMPYLDTYATPNLQIEYSQLTPEYSQKLVTFEWLSKLPQHEIQAFEFDNRLTSSVCNVSVEGVVHQVNISSPFNETEFEKAFESITNIVGNITVFYKHRYPSRIYVMFDNLIEDIPLIQCSNNMTTS